MLSLEWLDWRKGREHMKFVKGIIPTTMVLFSNLSCQTRHITLEYSHSIRRASNTSWNIQRHASDKKGVSSLFLTLFAKLLEIEELAYHAKSAEESHGIFLSPQTLVRVRSHEMTELPIGIPQPLSMTSCSARSSSPPLSGVCQIGKLSQPG
jgi:hypothetical protein